MQRKDLIITCDTARKGYEPFCIYYIADNKYYLVETHSSYIAAYKAVQILNNHEINNNRPAKYQYVYLP